MTDNDVPRVRRVIYANPLDVWFEAAPQTVSAIVLLGSFLGYFNATRRKKRADAMRVEAETDLVEAAAERVRVDTAQQRRRHEAEMRDLNSAVDLNLQLRNAVFDVVAPRVPPPVRHPIAEALPGVIDEFTNVERIGVLVDIAMSIQGVAVVERPGALPPGEVAADEAG